MFNICTKKHIDPIFLDVSNNFFHLIVTRLMNQFKGIIKNELSNASAIDFSHRGYEISFSPFLAIITLCDSKS